MPTSCEIEFDDNPMRIVLAGELLCGTVRLKFTKEQCIRAIYIRMYGHASVKLDDPTRSSNRQTYLNKKIFLVHGNNGKIRMMPGIYSYRFQCVIPPNIPSSVEGSIGHIRYSACLTIDIPMFQSKEFQQHFVVLKTIDLNNYPVLREPVIVTKNKSFFLSGIGMLCGMSSKLLNIVARIPVRGYTPRQVIQLELFVNNMTGKSVSEFKVQLIKQIKYLHFRKEFLPIAEHRVHGCNAHQEQLICVYIPVPPIFPTDVPTFPTKIIEVEHLIRITGSIVGCHKKVMLHLPITIGSYPFQETIASQAVSPFSFSNMEMQSDTISGLSSTLATQQQQRQRQQRISMPQVPLSTNQNANFMHPTMPCGYCDCHLNGCKFLCDLPTYEQATASNQSSLQSVQDKDATTPIER